MHHLMRKITKIFYGLSLLLGVIACNQGDKKTTEKTALNSPTTKQVPPTAVLANSAIPQQPNVLAVPKNVDDEIAPTDFDNLAKRPEEQYPAQLLKNLRSMFKLTTREPFKVTSLEDIALDQAP